MHGRRSIIKRRDDDDITMTRPLNKRVSFSANNYTRLFQVDSDDSTRQTNLDSTGQQSTMSLMEHTMSHTINVSEFNRSSSTGAMETTHIDDLADDGEGAGFDWMDENMEVESSLPADPSPSAAEMQPAEPTNRLEKQPASNRTSFDTDDKTRPVELHTERTDIVKNEILKVASKLLKPGGSADGTKSSLDIYGIQATLNSQTARQENAEHAVELEVSPRPAVREANSFNDIFETTSVGNQSSSFSQSRLEATMEPSRASLNPYTEPSLSASCEMDGTAEMSDVHMYEESENLQYEESDIVEAEASSEESRRFSSQETTQGQSESWFECTGVNNLDQDEETSMKFSERTPSRENASNHSPGSRDITCSEAETIENEEAEFEESRHSNRLASSRDSMVRPRVKRTVKERSMFESVDGSDAEISSAPSKVKCLKSRRSTMVDIRIELSKSVEESECASPKSQILPKHLSPCLEESSRLSSLRVEQRTFDVSPADPGSARSTRRTFDVLPDDSDSLHSKRRTFDVLPVNSTLTHPTRRTFDVSATNETYSVHHTAQVPTRRRTSADASDLADEPPASFIQDVTLASLNRSNRSMLPIEDGPEEDWTLEDWIEHDPELFSVFAEPFPEYEPVPTVEYSATQIIELDEDRLEKAITVEVDPEFESFLETQRGRMRKVLDDLRRTQAKLEAHLDQEMRVLIDDLPFYRELSPHKFRISTDRKSKTVTVCYRVSSPNSLFPCVTIECKEKKDTTVSCTAKLVELPLAVCSFSSYVAHWVENALNGRSHFNAKTWKEAQDKVLSALKVIDVHFNALESVRYNLHWCEERREVYLNMLWRDRVVRAYVDADLREELVPQDATTDLSFRNNELQAAWRTDGIMNYRERINNVHRRNLEIAAEETIKSAKF